PSSAWPASWIHDGFGQGDPEFFFNASAGWEDYIISDLLHVIKSPACGNGVIEGPEQCDNGTNNTNIACTAPPGGSCTYCDNSCNVHTVFDADNSPPTVQFVPPTPASGHWMNNFVPVNVSAADTQNNISTFIDFDNSLAGWWRMDDYNSSGAYDNSSYGNFGVFAGDLNAGRIVNGRMGKSLEFDGDRDYLDISAFNLDGTGELSINLWINPRSISNKAPSMGPANDSEILILRHSQDALSLSLGNDDELYAYIDVGGNKCNITTNSDIISLDEWQMISAVYDGNNLAIYHNGASVGSCVVGTAAFSGSGQHKIGAYCPGALSSCRAGFDGFIDDVMIFKRTLGGDEIKALYADALSALLFWNFANINYGYHNFRACSQDTWGNTACVGRTILYDLCILSNVAIMLNDSDSSGYAGEGESITMTAEINNGTYCKDANRFYINASSGSSNCTISWTSGIISGIVDQISIQDNDASIKASWTIPNIPMSCLGRRMNASYGGLYQNTESNIISNLAAASGFFVFAPPKPPSYLENMLSVPRNATVILGFEKNNTATASWDDYGVVFNSSIAGNIIPFRKHGQIDLTDPSLLNPPYKNNYYNSSKHLLKYYWGKAPANLRKISTAGTYRIYLELRDANYALINVNNKQRIHSNVFTVS
ncbi:hypothetical protein GF323_04055, partial [Candidatus Woesearchaeota archaeon]|nr:hypothetical protein [Candidatus Woesearchaeota archaeon]